MRFTRGQRAHLLKLVASPMYGYRRPAPTQASLLARFHAMSPEEKDAFGERVHRVLFSALGLDY